MPEGLPGVMAQMLVLGTMALYWPATRGDFVSIGNNALSASWIMVFFPGQLKQ